MKSNCLIVAIYQSIKDKGHLYAILPKKGGRTIPHFFWSKGDKYYHYTKNGKVEKLFQEYWFNGYIEELNSKIIQKADIKKVW